jgi:hypothetical protein
MKRIGAITVGAAVLVFSSAAAAQPNTSSRNGTMVRAFEVTTQNQVKNPQAPGLARARERITENAAKHLAHGNGPGAPVVERQDGVEHVERVERPERPQVALSPSVTERPLPPGLADRPLPPGHARRR